MKYRTEWNLALLYKSEKDPQIERDIQKVELLCANFEKKYRNKDFIGTPAKLSKAIDDYHQLSEPVLFRPLFYFFLRSDIESDNSAIQARMTAIEQRISTASNKITFFELALGKIPSATQKMFLESPLLKEVRYYLQRIFLKAKYNLTEKEEQLNTLLHQTSEVMWTTTHQKKLSSLMVPYKGKQIPFSKAKDLFSDLPKKDRHILFRNMNEADKSIAFLAEAELNAICNYRKVMDERRGYPMPYSESLVRSENTDEEIESFTQQITKAFPIAHRFYKLHAKLLKEKKLTFADRRVQVGAIKRKFDFDSTLAISRAALARAGEQYAVMLDRFMDRGQIDVFPRKGKRAGGYQISIGTLPTYILLNHVDNIQSSEVITHEMGHAIHSELDNDLPHFYQGHSIATAEVASMFFEQFSGLELDQYLSDEEKFTMLHRGLCEDMYAIFAQVACFNFETELHQQIRAHGQLSKEEMARLMQKHMQAYCGPAIEVTEDDGYLFVHWSHIRMYFYTYSYAYGGLISRVLFENWKKDSSYIKKVEQFLRAGKSMTPKNIFKSIGIVTNNKFFEVGLTGIKQDIDRLERLAKKLKKI